MNKIKEIISSWIDAYHQDQIRNNVILVSLLVLTLIPESLSALNTVILAVLIFCLNYRTKDFGLTPSSACNLGYAFITALCLFMLAQVWSVVCSETLFTMPFTYSLSTLILYSIVLAILDEVAYRGFIINLKPILKSNIMILILIMLMTMCHMRSWSGLLIGLVLGLMTIRSGSVYPAIFTSFLTRILLIYEIHHIEQFTWLLRFFSTRTLAERIGMFLIGSGLIALAISYANRCVQEPIIEEPEIIKINRIQIPKAPLWRNEGKTSRQAYALKRIYKRNL